MKIGIDYRPAFLSLTGVGRYTRAITEAMAGLLGAGDELRLFAVSLARGVHGLSSLPEPGRGRVVAARKRFPGRLIHLLGRFGLIGVESFTGPLDSFLYTDLVYPPLVKTPHCVMVHDLAFIRSKDFHGRGFGRKVWRRMVPVLEKAGAILTPSPTTAEDLAHHLPATARKIHVVAHGCEHLTPSMGVEPRRAGGAEGSYFLAVGTLEPRKNWIGVLSAFESIADSFPDTELIFAGTPGWLYAPFVQKIERSPVRHRIRLVEGVDDSVLADLYSRAICLVYPSFWEGFGFPVAEAMSLNCPVITSNRSSLSWLAGEAALLVDPEAEGEIAAAMKRLAADDKLGRDLAQAGLERIKPFTWKQAGRTTLEVIHEAID